MELGLSRRGIRVRETLMTKAKCSYSGRAEFTSPDAVHFYLESCVSIRTLIWEKTYLFREI